MQPIIAMKFAEYVAWILFCKHGKFGEKIFYNSRNMEFFVGGLLFWRALYMHDNWKWNFSFTRKLCYRKDDRAMHAI